jgi:hypothetical protein
MERAIVEPDSVIGPDLSLKYSRAPGAVLARRFDQSLRAHDYGSARPLGPRLCLNFPATFRQFP